MSKIIYRHTNVLHNIKDALEILPFIFNLFKPQSIIDIGCGNGSWLNASKTLGVSTVQGVDGIHVENDQLLIEESEFLQHDLTIPLKLGKTFDLAISLEVAEHLHEVSADTIIDTLCNHSEVVLFSGAIPGQGGQFHFNEQWPEYWHLKFKKRGYLAYDIIRPEFWNNTNVYWWYRQNTILYIKEGNSLAKKLGSGSKQINALIHPELYGRKMDKPKYIDRSRQFKLLKHTIKLLIKSAK